MGANPNTISDGFQEVWDKQYQITHHKIPTYPAWSTFRLASGIQKGDTVNRMYRSSMVVNDMGADGSYQRQGVTDTKEQLVINKEKETTFYIKELDELQAHLPTRSEYASDAMVGLFNQIDGDVLGSYDQYTNTLDDGDLGGTSGNGITVTTSNVRQLFSRSNKLLQRGSINLARSAKFSGVRIKDMGAQRGVALLSPDVFNMLLESLDGKDSALGDTVGINGHCGRYFNFDLFVSNGVGWSGRLEFGTQPTDQDTVVINGVTFKFVTGTPTDAGDVKSETNAATSLDNLVAAINAPGTSVSGKFVALSSANQALMKNIAATDGTTYMTLKVTGKGFISVSETLTAAADIWTLTKQVQHCLIGVNNAVDLVIQKTPTIKIKDRDGYIGSDVVTWAAYGYKVFNEQKALMIDVWVRTDAY